MIRVQLFDPLEKSLQVGGEELLTQWQSNPHLLVWMDLQDNVKKEEMELLTEVFALHPLAIEDAQRQRHPPKLELFDDTVFLLLKGLDAETDSIDFGTIQLALFINDRFLITRHSDKSLSTERLWSRYAQNAELWSDTRAIALSLTGMVVDRYLKILLNLEPRLDELEDEIQATPKDTHLHELSEYRTRLKKMRRYLTYQVQMFKGLIDNDSQTMGVSREHDLVDVFDRLERANSLANLYTELTTDLMESYISLASHHLNNIMKILTIVTVIFVPLTFMAGIYGMNFQHMPELSYQYAYFFLLSAMFTVALFLLFVFRRMKWL